jgi:hypothetical protein
MPDKKQSECSGCLTYNNNTGTCHIKIIDVHLCPCQQCLVKCMCREICDEYIDFISEEETESQS